nr:equilibrative nucleotide transporter 3 [Quercus suber]
MTIAVETETPTRLERKHRAMVVCFFLGLGSLVSWSSMLTIGDYYYQLFPLDFTTSGKGGIGPFIGLCVLSACFGVADAHVQGGMLGDLSFMCPEFIQSFLGGLAASGALASGLRLLTKVSFEKTHNGLRKGATLFLAISTFFEFLCILLYAIVFAKLPIVKYYRSKAASEGSKTVSSDLAAAGIQTDSNKGDEDDAKQLERLSNQQLFFQNIDYAIGLFLIYVLTLSISPGFLYENTGTHGLGSWYAPVLIAMYNVWDLISRYIPLIESLKLESRKGLMIAILSRFLFIPAFYFCAKYGDKGWMILLTSLLGVSNGYLTVCVLTVAPKGYKGPEQNALGNLLVLCVLFGLFAGVALDWLWLIGKGGIGPFIGLCVLSACFGVADAHVQGGMLGDLSFMCPEFIQSFLGGLAASGALASGLRLLTKVSFEKTHNGLRKGATLFLAISTFFEFLCILLYAIVFAKLPIVKYYRSKAASEGSKTVSSDLAAAGIQTNSNQGDEDDAKHLERLSNKQLFFQNIDYAIGLFLIYVLTLSIIPGFLYENTGTHGLGSWYAPVLIAMYNVWDLISRYIPLIESLKLESRKGLMIAILSRFLFIPAFYFCTKYGNKGWMILLTSLLAVSNGYLTVCVLTVAPKGYKGPEQNALGNLLVLCLLCGLFAGVALDWLWLIDCGIARIILVSDKLTKVRGARVFTAGDDMGAGDKLVGAMEMGRRY